MENADSSDSRAVSDDLSAASCEEGGVIGPLEVVSFHLTNRYRRDFKKLHHTIQEAVNLEKTAI